jgi:hypothetical protein
MENKLYYYAGYDSVHRLSKIKNFYWDTKENIINYLKSQCEFKEGTTQEEIDENIELMFKCYTEETNERTKLTQNLADNK